MCGGAEDRDLSSSTRLVHRDRLIGIRRQRFPRYRTAPSLPRAAAIGRSMNRRDAARSNRCRTTCAMPCGVVRRTPVRDRRGLRWRSASGQRASSRSLRILLSPLPVRTAGLVNLGSPGPRS